MFQTTFFHIKEASHDPLWFYFEQEKCIVRYIGPFEDKEVVFGVEYLDHETGVSSTDFV